MELTSYKNLKETEVDWLPKLPGHWNLIRFRHLFTFGRGLGITKKNLVDRGVPCLNYGEVHSKFGFEVSPEKHTLKCVDESYLDAGRSSLLSFGDFVFADTSEDLDGSGNFTYLNSETEIFAGYHTVIARLKTEDIPRYVAYLFDSQLFRFQIKKSVSGVKVFSVTQAILRSNYVWLPPIDEQLKIVGFLDSKTKKISGLIESKKALIERLKERKVVLITKLVTKGLKHDAMQKYSGIDWLGEIPSGWSLKSLRFIGRCTNGINIGGEYFGKGDPFVSYGDVYNNRELPRSVKGLVQSSESDKKAYSVDVGDVFFTRTSETVEEIGFSSVCMEAIENAVFAGFLIRFRPGTSEIIKEFSKYYFQNNLLRAFFVKEMNLVTRASLSQDLLKKLPVLLPPKEEQIEIAAYLDRETKKIDETIDKVAKAIIKLEEYRIAVITGAVTGQIDVVNFEAPERV